MANLLAFVLVAWSGAHHPTRIDEAQTDRPVQQIYQAGPRMSPRQRMWFEHAIDRILKGK